MQLETQQGWEDMAALLRSEAEAELFWRHRQSVLLRLLARP